jgi:uncharacterized membrane protein (Fun14 family)
MPLGLRYCHSIIIATLILTVAIILIIIFQMILLNKYSLILLRVQTYLSHLSPLIFLSFLIFLFESWLNSKRNYIIVLYTISLSLGGGFFGGILIRYVLKKVLKILSIVVGLFLAGLTYLQSQELAKINWDKLQSLSQGAISNLANATTQQNFNNIGGGNDHTVVDIAMTRSMSKYE